jgi:hypothetical protein
MFSIFSPPNATVTDEITKTRIRLLACVSLAGVRTWVCHYVAPDVDYSALFHEGHNPIQNPTILAPLSRGPALVHEEQGVGVKHPYTMDAILKNSVEAQGVTGCLPPSLAINSSLRW